MKKPATKSSNPQAVADVNQKRGPQVGNAGNKTKHGDFVAAKAKVNSERSRLAKMVTDALELRGRSTQSKYNPGVESLHDTTNVGRGPTKGNAGR